MNGFDLTDLILFGDLPDAGQVAPPVEVLAVVEAVQLEGNLLQLGPQRLRMVDFVLEQLLLLLVMLLQGHLLLHAQKIDGRMSLVQDVQIRVQHLRLSCHTVKIHDTDRAIACLVWKISQENRSAPKPFAASN
jgi:hypothetical protein